MKEIFHKIGRAFLKNNVRRNPGGTFLHRKLSSDSGETIVETLFTMLVVALAMLMLAGAITAAARVNNNTKKLDTAFHTEGGINNEGTVSVEEKSGRVTIKRSGAGLDAQLDVTYYVTQDGNEYWYYQ